MRIGLPLGLWAVETALSVPAGWAQQPVVPLPRRGACPLGYVTSGSYCTPAPGGQSRGALERSGGSNCPLGFSASGSYCVSNPGNQRQAIPREGSICPLGYLRSGSYCVESGAGGR